MFSLSSPALVELLGSFLLCAGVLLAGGLALFLLPWTDAEIERVDAGARAALPVVLRRAVALLR